MPVLWQSSQRPMYIRTVWVGGFRHAILSHDDPYFLMFNAKKRRPHSSATCLSNKTTRSSRFNLENCVNKFNYTTTLSPRTDSSCNTPVDKLNLTDVDSSEEEFAIKANQQPLNEFHSNKYKFDNFSINMKSMRMNKTDRPERKEDTELSDRVLQWLDLAGKVDLLAPTENTERMSQPRHSWPEIQRNQLTKSKTAVDIRHKESAKGSPKIVENAKAQPNVFIDRHELYEATSANTIENYARQSRNVKIASRNELAMKTKDNHSKTKNNLKNNIQETRRKLAKEKDAMEKQYAELLNQKLIPDLKSNKKQVHIFMPDLPKKGLSDISEATSRTESLLSQPPQAKKKLNKRVP